MLQWPLVSAVQPHRQQIAIALVLLRASILPTPPSLKLRQGLGHRPHLSLHFWPAGRGHGLLSHDRSGGCIHPTFTFTVAGRASVCNSQPAAGFQTSATATGVNLGRIGSASLSGGAQDLTVATNAGGGFTVYMRTPGTTPNAMRDAANHVIADVSGTRASPGSAPVAGSTGFGYTSDDTATAFTSNTWAKLTNAGDSVMIGSGATTSKSNCVGYEVAVGPTTPAGSYAVTVVYTAVPAF